MMLTVKNTVQLVAGNNFIQIYRFSIHIYVHLKDE